MNVDSTNAWVGETRAAWGLPGAVSYSDDVLAVAGWLVPRWAAATYNLTSGELTARAEIEEAGTAFRASITQLTIGDGSQRISAMHLRDLASALPDLPFLVLFYVSKLDHPPVRADQPEATDAFRRAVEASLDSFVRAMRRAGKVSGVTQVESEDEVLRRWEEEFKPQGRRQHEAASELGLAYSTFRTYLAHARARRDRP